MSIVSACVYSQKLLTVVPTRSKGEREGV